MDYRSEPTVLGLSSEPAEASAGFADEQLAYALKQADEAAYEELIQRFEQPVFNLVCRLLNDPGDAGDVVQDVFIKVFRNISTFRNQSSLKTWIYRIAVNEARNHQRWHFRHRRREVGIEPGEPGANSWAELTNPEPSPFSYVFGRECHELLEEALGAINPDFRAAVVLREIEGLSYEEAAAILGVAMGTVKSRILRGKEAIREYLSGRLEGQPAFSWAPQVAAD